jgi:DnaK suppressor protein
VILTSNELDEKFIAHQKERLQNLKEELLRVRRGMTEDEQERSDEYQDTQPDSGDESQYMFTRGMNATIGEQVERRLGDVDRALQKIEEGTYGLSDVSAEPIPRGRLQAIPEAIRTVEEQQRFERERRPPL